MAALAAGKHVFVEKPLASSSGEAFELIDRARDEGLVLMPGHTFLYSPPVVMIKDIIDAGELGDIYFISMSRVNLGIHQSDVSVVWDLGPHDFSILRFWLDESPSEVSGMARDCVYPGTPDVAFVSARFPSGTVAHLELAWLSPSKLRRTAIVGSRKMIVYDDLEPGAGPDLRLRRRVRGPRDVRRVPAFVSDGGHRLAQARCDGAACARDHRLLLGDPRRQRASVIHGDRPRCRPDDRGSRSLARSQRRDRADRRDDQALELTT